MFIKPFRIVKHCHACRIRYAPPSHPLKMKPKILILSLLSLLQFVLVHFVLIQQFANSGDEQAFLFQAKLFSRGQLYVTDPIYDRANPLNKYVRSDALDDLEGRRFSKYDPGWAALLSLGSRARAEGLVAPLLGALTVFLLLSYVSRRLGDEFVGTTWWLVTLCSFFCYSVANYGSHTATMVFLFGAFVLYDYTLDESHSQRFGLRLFAVGLLLGYCSLIRYLDWMPLMAWIAFDLLRQRKIRGLILVLLGFGLLASVHLFYDKLLTGSALLPPAVHDARGNLQARLGVHWGGFRITALRLWRVLYTFPPVVLLLLCLRWPCRSAKLKVYVTLFALNVCVYFFYAWTVAGPGPRYLFPYFPFLILAVVEVVRLNRERGQRIRKIGWGLVMASLIVCSIVYGDGQTREIYKRLDLERAVAAIPEKKRIILLQTGTYEMKIADLIRNPPDLWSADTLYLDYDDGVGIPTLLKRFPNHSVYVYRYPGSLKPWSG
jgi:hypothetical protein